MVRINKRNRKKTPDTSPSNTEQPPSKIDKIGAERNTSDEGMEVEEEKRKKGNPVNIQMETDGEAEVERTTTELASFFDELMSQEAREATKQAEGVANKKMDKNAGASGQSNRLNNSKNHPPKKPQLKKPPPPIHFASESASTSRSIQLPSEYEKLPGEEENEPEEKEEDDPNQVLLTHEKPEFRALGAVMAKLLDGQKGNFTKIKKLEKAVDDIGGKLNDVIRYVKDMDERVGDVGCTVEAGNGARMINVEKEIAAMSREINDSYIVIAGIPNATKNEEKEDTKETALAVLKDGGFGELGKKLITAWRVKKRGQNQPNDRPPLIIAKFESLQAKQKIMARIKELATSSTYPDRMFFPRKSALELKGNYRLTRVFHALQADGWKVEKRRGGFAMVEGKRVYGPTDFLCSTIEIDGKQLDVDMMSK
jgi:hypothetical protein